MDFTYFRILSVGGILVVALVTTAGAIAVSLLMAWVVETSLAVAGWLGLVRGAASAAKPREAGIAETPAADRSFEVDGAPHALLARQPWWRLRC